MNEKYYVFGKKSEINSRNYRFDKNSLKFTENHRKFTAISLKIHGNFTNIHGFTEISLSIFDLNTESQ